MTTSELPPYKTSLAKQYDVYPFVDPSRFAGKLKGKVVLISGASSGIGKNCAYTFAAAGASVVCVARRQALLDDLVKELKDQHNVPALAIAADLLYDTAATAKSLVEKAEATLGPIDILINNAGACPISRFVDIKDVQEWWSTMRLNVEVPITLIHAILPSMLARNSGILINLASTAGAHDGHEMGTAYGTSKAAMIKFHHVLDKELASTGVSSFSVHPGNIWTDMVSTNFAEMGEKYPEIVKAMQEKGNPYLDLKWQTTELAAATILTLCAEERCKALSGRYIDGEQDLEKIIEAAESGRVKAERLYWLKVEEL